MAEQPNIRQILSSIETDPAEMARFRQNTAALLAAGAPRRRFSGGWWFAAAGLAAVLVLGWFFRPGDPVFRVEPLEELCDLVRRHQSDSLRRAAYGYLRKGTERQRENANMVLCLLEPDESGLARASQGLSLDPRPEFRAFYLEFLLDHTDDRRLNLDLLDTLMDGEQDTYCLHLYGELIKMGRRNAEHFPS